MKNVTPMKCEKLQGHNNRKTYTLEKKADEDGGRRGTQI